MKTAIYPGSFDPVTLGHLDIIERAAVIFDRLIVAVLHNGQKRSWLSVEKRLHLLGRAVAHLPNVVVDTSAKLLADYAAEQGRVVIVKGLRAMSDFEHEFQMAMINRHLNPSLDTLFLTSSEHFQYLSSSMIREIGTMGGDISDFVPSAIVQDLTEYLNRDYMKNRQACPD